MIAVDTNLLVYAHRRDAAFHEQAATLVRDLAEGRRRWAIPWPCVHEFLAIVTHPRIFDPPTGVRPAIDQVAAWMESPSLALIGETTDHWDRLVELVSGSGVVGPRVHDARVATICLSHGVSRLWTLDRDFSRFTPLRTTNPLA
ncbi:MAG: PIN domain-containing protein [Euzebyaceae bacterium]|nr:PIN domain-containing protein [Euzebyaceae bacterium]